jgi:hypothetical protein
VLQVVQNGVLVVAVGGPISVLAALCSEGIHLVGASVGDLIPGQIGATEGSYTLFAKVLGMVPADAVTIAMVAHLAQLTWVVIGLVATALWRARNGLHGPGEKTIESIDA